jgi:hypothetical protein
MSYRKFFKFDEIFIIRKILEYADLGLDIFFDEHKKKHYLKFDPNNQKFSSIDTFFSRIFYHYRKSIICIFNTQIHFISSELTFPPHKTISFFQITENNKKIIREPADSAEPMPTQGAFGQGERSSLAVDRRRRS